MRGQCNHSIECHNPGIQQVLIRDGRLQVGYVNGEEYVNWVTAGKDLSEEDVTAWLEKGPPTHAHGRTIELSQDRQRRLGLTNPQELFRQLF